ncbi:MAG: hypothetical protein MMC33_009063 [Icmadophila ericetorum]|nr:hypothetical protein [Icmadophila ericetorum]
MTRASSISSATVAVDEKSHEISHNVHRDKGILEPITSSTEANILPETADQPGELEADMEKAEAEGKRPNLGMMDPSSFPDGGRKAWLVIFGSFCCLFCSFGWINCIGVFQTYYQTHELSQYTPSTVAWITSLETFMMFLGGPFFGYIYDCYGPRYLLLAGTFLHVFGLMMASISTQYYQFILAQGICSPIGASAIFYPAVSSSSTWFFRRRALALGVVASGSSLGGVIFPILVQRLIPQIGFPWTMRVAAFLILSLLVIANLTVRSRIPPTWKPFRPIDFITPLKETPYLLVVIASFLFFIGLFLPLTYIILQAQYSGMSPYLASYLLAILNATSIFGRTIPGYLADRYGRLNITVITSVFSGIIVLALWLPATTNAPIIVFAVLYGFGSGAFVSMVPAVIAQISDIRQIGMRTGTLFAIISVGALCGGPIGGAFIDSQDGAFGHLQIFGGVMLLAGAAMFMFARVSLVGWTILKKV